MLPLTGEPATRWLGLLAGRHRCTPPCSAWLPALGHGRLPQGVPGRPPIAPSAAAWRAGAVVHRRRVIWSRLVGTVGPAAGTADCLAARRSPGCRITQQLPSHGLPRLR